MKKISALFLAILLCLALPVTVLAFSGGNGSPGNPFIITTAAELDAVRDHIYVIVRRRLPSFSHPPTTFRDLHAHFRLGNDIDLTDYLAPGGDGYAKWGWRGWEPIGVSHFGIGISGSFDGNGHVVRGLWINRIGSNEVGLFASSRGEIRNLGVEIAAAGVIGGRRAGGLVGTQWSGTIINSYATGNVSAGTGVGGLVGAIEDGSIKNSYATGNVSGARLVGGLVGFQSSSGSITNSYATGNVSGTGDSVGGLVGGNMGGSITNSYAMGDVNGRHSVGGLVGELRGGTITNSYATGNVSDTSSGGSGGVGGLVGVNVDGSITESYATGNVSGSGDGVGRLVGQQRDGTITNSSATGNVSGAGGQGHQRGAFRSATIALPATPSPNEYPHQ